MDDRTNDTPLVTAEKKIMFMYNSVYIITKINAGYSGYDT